MKAKQGVCVSDMETETKNPHLPLLARKIPKLSWSKLSLSARIWQHRDPDSHKRLPTVPNFVPYFVP
jgi:hypothetical protein